MKRILIIPLSLLFLLSGCAAKDPVEAGESASPASPAVQTGLPPHDEPLDDSAFDDEDLLDDSALDDEDDFLDDSEFDRDMPLRGLPIYDPLEGWNRVWFEFNDVFWMQVLKPVYDGYEYLVHEDIRSGLSNALHNIQAPIRIVNSVLQLEFAQAMVEFGRFMINSTFGGLGLMDLVPVEKALVPVNLQTADFSGTLAKWGVGEGFYLVWPVLGPSTLRDTVGMFGDAAAAPEFWLTKPIGPVSPWIAYTEGGVLRFNHLGGMLKEYEALRKASIEPYSALRDAYIKLRRNTMFPDN